jgi:hypothetical protein
MQAESKNTPLTPSPTAKIPTEQPRKSTQPRPKPKRMVKGSRKLDPNNPEDMIRFFTAVYSTENAVRDILLLLQKQENESVSKEPCLTNSPTRGRKRNTKTSEVKACSLPLLTCT